ncbi:Na/Pi cotransporter family protein [Marinospirillum alkaliphilum]|uniref:Phosphate:Na+ symporter n=1 Tax=Marinospirillum alkaliphilum DSM 21637 TaxID=1122209 RepID=A0A1K1WTD0_9GAMM|nr:Na/Pi symporter [Marinospirillum alkaliphilum]SFX40519.1 phosphate:Na+ symporter [Marinospirillum alkaliphilum DSM 21637]
MLKKFTFPAVLLFLAYALWANADFMEIAAGVALFMFGMLCLEEGFKAFTGGTLETILRKSTDRLWKSLAFGMTSTTVMQSSSLVSLITVSFVSAEMITLAAGIGIIMGANIGTTTGAWLIAGLGLKVDIAAYAMPVLVFGMVFMMQKSKVRKGIGSLMLGFAFLFLGIHFMKEGFEAFQQTFDLTEYAMTGLAGVLVFTLIGMLITVIMQSSHASLLIIITALSAGQVNYENALALAIGANLGSTITIVLGSIASNLGGKRLAASHVLFNVLTAVVAISFITQLGQLVDVLAELLGIREQDYLLKLALFHTLFNLLGVVMLTPFVGKLEAALIRHIRFEAKTTEKPLYLFPEALETPATVVNAVRKEVQHLFDNAFGLLAHGLSLKRATIESDESLADAVKYTRRIIPLDVEDLYEAKIKSLHSDIVAFIGEAQTRESTRTATEELYVLRQASRDIVEAVKGMKHLHNNLSRHGLSSNLAVRERYDQIRLQLAKLLRELRELLKEEPSDVTSLSLDSLKLSLEKASRKMIDDLDEMIRNRRIAPSIATSIMNDENYATEISRSLLDAVHTLIRPAVAAQAEPLSLDEKELQQLMEQDSESSR